MIADLSRGADLPQAAADGISCTLGIIDPRTLQVHQRGRRRLAFCIRQGRILTFRTWEFLAGIHLNLDGPFANAKRLVADIDDVPT